MGRLDLVVSNNGTKNSQIDIAFVVFMMPILFLDAIFGFYSSTLLTPALKFLEALSNHQNFLQLVSMQVCIQVCPLTLDECCFPPLT